MSSGGVTSEITELQQVASGLTPAVTVTDAGDRHWPTLHRGADWKDPDLRRGTLSPSVIHALAFCGMNSKENEGAGGYGNNASHNERHILLFDSRGNFAARPAGADGAGTRLGTRE